MIGPIALAWHRNGFCAVPVRSDGSKTPGLNDWKEFQKRLPNETELRNWWSNPERQGFGLIMGAVSGNAEMLEFEGRAVALLPEVMQRATAVGITEIFVKLWTGYRELTPSGGIHLVFRVSDGPALGNTKLARRPRTFDELLEYLPAEIARLESKKAPAQYLIDDYVTLTSNEANGADRPDDTLRIGRKHPLVLIETRGEGGFTVTAPSNGTTHPSGGAWTLQAGTSGVVPTITAAERDALYDMLRSFDEMPQAAQKQLPIPRKIDHAFAQHASVHVSPLDAFNDSANWADILVPHGWKYDHNDDAGTAYWIRPGKDTPGFSATTGRSDTGDRLYVFSTSTPFEAETPMSKAFVWAHYNHDGDMQAARAALYEAGWGDRRVDRSGDRQSAIAFEDCEFDGMSLPDEFWEARPILSQIRQLGWSTRRMPEGLLGLALTRVLAHVSPSVVLCGQTGGSAGKASLNFMAVLVGASGHGKSQGADIIEEKLIVNYPYMPTNAYTAGMGEQEKPKRRKPNSGQGLPFLYQKRAGKGQTHGSRTNYLAYCHIDEGSGLERSTSIKGADPTSSLCEAWSGEDLSAENAGDTRSRVERHTYRMAVTLNTQPERAAWLVSGIAVDTGLTQRLVWFNTYRYPGRPLPEERPEEPADLIIALPDEAALVFNQDAADAFALTGEPAWVAAEHSTVMTMAPMERADTDALEDFLDEGGVLAPMDAHRNLLRRKVAAALSLLDGRITRTDEDWILAGMVMDASDAVRGYTMGIVMAKLAEENERVARTRGRAQHIQNKTVAELEAEVRSGLADAVISFVRDRGSVSMRDIRRGPGKRKGATEALDSVVQELLDEGRIEQTPVVHSNGQETFTYSAPEENDE